MNSCSRRMGAAGALLSLCLAALPAVAADNLYALHRQWWQWFVNIPIDFHPQVDETGAACDLAQRGKYWFLVGSNDGEVNRSCTVPVGVKLVVPLDNTFCYPEEGVDTNESCIAWVDAWYDGLDQADFVVKLDNVVQPKVDVCEVAAHPTDVVQALPAACVIIRRKDRALFSFAIGQYSVLASPVGVYRANAARGLWAVVDTATLALGAHVLRVTTPFQTVRYNLKVARAKN
jgi:hypothetical protein